MNSLNPVEKATSSILLHLTNIIKSSDYSVPNGKTVLKSINDDQVCKISCENIQKNILQLNSIASSLLNSSLLYNQDFSDIISREETLDHQIHCCKKDISQLHLDISKVLNEINKVVYL